MSWHLGAMLRDAMHVKVNLKGEIDDVTLLLTVQKTFLHHMLTNFRYQVLYLKNLSLSSSIQGKG
jgi:hypothetical protein